MSTTRLILAYAALAALAGPLTALAQQPDTPAAPRATPPAADTAPSRPTAQSEAGEPRATLQSEAGEPRATAPSEAGEPRSSVPTEAGEPRAKSSSRPPQVAPEARGQAGTRDGKTASDRLDLGTATVTGDQEQPKVMYIVPWKKSDIGDLSGKPMNSLLDEALAPVDRDEFKRQVAYYHAVNADASQNGAKPSAQQGEK